MLARQGDTDKCQEPRVPFLATLKFIQMVQSSILLCWKKKKARKGMRHDRPIEKRGGFCELTDTPSARARSYQRDRPKGPLWPLCFITSTNCADAHVRKQGKQKTWYNCTTESQLSTDHWSMEKTSNKTQHHDCHGTTEFISSVRTILTNIHPPNTSGGDKDLEWAFSLYIN